MKLVFIHGLSGSQHNFDRLRTYFTEDTVSFDLPGHGTAPKPKRVYDKAYLLEYLREKIGTTEPVILIGHSTGAILAKDYAITHHDEVLGIIAISYPLHTGPRSLRRSIDKRPLLRHYARASYPSKLLCYSKHVWKWLILPFVYIFDRDNYPSVRDNFIHTNQAITSIIRDYLLLDDGSELESIKNKSLIIYGESDELPDKKYSSTFDHFEIASMGHQFFGYEAEIAKKIQEFMNSLVR
jgi:pimeloyl-ACP methyl ester carboxylesterase